jgi:hypothetical protein
LRQAGARDAGRRPDAEDRLQQRQCHLAPTCPKHALQGVDLHPSHIDDATALYVRHVISEVRV